ncbi:MAG: hypothetical protein SP1CHLAM54_01170 [Chlamydiia bacterium]|nr:hypothetical protein [Chlamydiia bacterium]MCH9615039.1 hypothetical protein [Chlamydiia bacterium]MCH9629910.1 hypothetical protein [Chlamydiia bacterium]
MVMYRVMVEYQFKRGHEIKALRMLKTELSHIAHLAGCMETELLMGDRKGHCIALGLWTSMAAAKKFQPEFDRFMKEMAPHLTKKPMRRIHKVGHYMQIHDLRSAA